MKEKLARVYIIIFTLFAFGASLYCVYQLLDGHKVLQALYFPLHIGSFYMMLCWRTNNK